MSGSTEYMTKAIIAEGADFVVVVGLFLLCRKPLLINYSSNLFSIISEYPSTRILMERAMVKSSCIGDSPGGPLTCSDDSSRSQAGIYTMSTSLIPLNLREMSV